MMRSHTSGTYASVLQSGTGMVARTLGSKALDILDGRDAGIVADGATNNASPFNVGVVEAMTSGRELVLPAGTILINSAQAFSASTAAMRQGFKIRGQGMGRTILDFSAVTSGVPLKFSSTTDWYRMALEGVQIVGATAAALVQIGDNAFGDPLNNLKMRDVVILNSKLDNAAIALKLNYVVNSTFDNVIANAYADGLGTNRGTALECNQVEFCTFVNGSFGNARYGIHFTNGVSHGNTFLTPDIENVDNCIRHTQAASGGQTFVNGQYSLYAQKAFYATSGLSRGTFEVLSPNYDSEANLLDATNYAGIVIRGGQAGITTPSLPASTVTATNTTGRIVEVVVWGGTVTAITVAGFGMGLTQGTVTVWPGETVAVTYSVAPTWAWRLV